MAHQAPKKLSTSALAKRLELTSQQLFSTLKDYGWIEKLEEGWGLTAKGEFEGGEYLHSQRYGRYIVWPEQIAEHQFLKALEDNQHISATQLGRQHGLNARQVNRIFAELGWITHSFQGWELTTSGEQRGGVQMENEASGSFYCLWPRAIAENSSLKAQLDYASQLNQPAEPADDLFSDQQSLQSIDGHQHPSRQHLQVGHWLYMAGLAHACGRRLPVDEELHADFYLPAQQLYIEVWGDGDASALAQRMQRQQVYEQLGVTVIDLEAQDFQDLDESLTRKFRKLGIRVY